MMRTSASTLLRRSLAGRTGAAKIVSTPAAATTTRASSTAIENLPLSNPTLANIEKRWEGMPLQDQADLWMALRDRMRGNWKDLTIQEKKAAYWIAFGPHGPRALPEPDFNFKVFVGTVASVAAAGLIFGIMRYFAKPAPHTMTQEWQEASNEYLIQQKAEPLTGISSVGYSGKGMVQSAPEGK